MAAQKKTRKSESAAPPPRKPPAPSGPRLGMLGAQPLWAAAVENAVFLLASGLALWFLVILYRSTGAIWRDEGNTVLLATVPDLRTMFAWLSKDTAPPLMHVLLRLWVFSGLGAGESGIRLFGILIFVLIIVSLYFSCRSLTGRAPIVAMSLVVFNATVFYYATSLRSYGLAMVMILPCYAAFWRFVVAPTRWNSLACAAFALLACQAGYLNAYLLFGIGTAAAIVCGLARFWKRGLALLAFCALAAASLMPYASSVREYEQVCIITKTPLDLWTIGGNFCEALSGGKIALLWAWIVLGALGVVALIVQVVRRGAGSRERGAGSGERGAGSGERGALGIIRGPSLALYFLIALPVTFVVGTVFFVLHQFYPSPWHFTPYVLLGGLGIEVSLGRGPGRMATWLWRIAVFAVVMILSIPASSRTVPDGQGSERTEVVPGVWTMAHQRRTNLDLVCDVLAERAGPQDLVLVTPFWLAPGFKYHYHGRAEWNTLPLTSSDLESSMFPYPAFKQVMETPRAIEATERKIANTLSEGHRLWIVGGIEYWPPNARPPERAPDPTYGWNNVIYSRAFTFQAVCNIQRHALSAKPIPVKVSGPVNPYENEPLLLIEGWQP